MLEMVNVGSPMIESIGYEAGSKKLHINFVSTEKYIYQGVPKTIHARLMRTHSIDLYFAEEIKDKYRHTEIY
jgi:hypothetical protein